MKLEAMQLIRVYPNEEFREIIIKDPLKLSYAISNKGRIKTKRLIDMVRSIP